MRIKFSHGFTLIELIVFIVIVGITVVTLGTVFQSAVIRIQDPVINSQLLAMAQSQLDETLSRKYDENTPTGGVPACGTSIACVGIGLDVGEILTDVSTLDDIDDFHNFQDAPQPGYIRQVSVVYAGADFGVAAENAKHITVSVTAPSGQQMYLSVYRFNF